jgi:DNA-binding transcriptional regulator/RsmH inhibitor MraZ
MSQVQVAEVKVPAPMGFHGVKVDPACRMKFPAKFLEYILSLPDKSLYITNIQGEARIYTNGAWQRNLARLNEEPELKRRMSEYYDSMGGDMDMDPQGRVTFPKNLRDSMSLEDQQLMLRFQDDMIFLYTMEQYEAIRDRNRTLHPTDLQLAKAKGFLV